MLIKLNSFSWVYGTVLMCIAIDLPSPCLQRTILASNAVDDGKNKPKSYFGHWSWTWMTWERKIQRATHQMSLLSDWQERLLELGEATLGLRHWKTWMAWVSVVKSASQGNDAVPSILLRKAPDWTCFKVRWRFKGFVCGATGESSIAYRSCLVRQT